MRTSFLVIWFIFINIISSIAQSITLDELIKLKNFDDKVNVEEYLSVHGWTFYRSKEQTDFSDRDIIIYAYNPVGPDNSAKTYITHYFDGLSISGSIKIETSSLTKYNELLARIKSFNCQLISSLSEYDFIRKIYQGKTTTFVVDIEKKVYFEVNVTVYSILVMHNYDYECCFEDVLDIH
jgi:hypothetical protein